MIPLDRRSLLLLLFAALPLLFLPKINLFSVGNESGGLRIDDAVLLILSLLILWSRTSLQLPVHPLEKGLVAYFFIGAFSFFTNQILQLSGHLSLQSNPLFVIRMAEYFTFFYIGTALREHFSLKRVMILLTAWIFAVMSLQKLGWLGHFSHVGYRYDTHRIFGIASFPSEMGMILNLIFAYFIATWDKEDSPPSILKILGVSALFTYFILLTGNRISVGAALLTLLYYFAKRLHSISFTHRTLYYFGLVLIFAVGTMGTSKTHIGQRMAQIVAKANTVGFEKVWKQINPKKLPTNVEDGSITEQHDLSLWIRMYKWFYALKWYVKTPLCYLQGLGPGTMGAAVDGGWLRLLVEMGVIGLSVFILLLRSLCRYCPGLIWLVFSLSLNMITFDVYLAYKPMIVLFFVAGATLPVESFYIAPLQKRDDAIGRAVATVEA